jgi:predicted nucleotidyltransferase
MELTNVSTIVPTGRKEPIGKALQQVINSIISHLNPQKIIMFGSYAFGKPTPDSDVDLLIIMETDLPSRERTWEVSRLIYPRPFPVDILVKTPNEIASAIEKGDYLINEILSSGIVLYDRRK